MSDNDRKMVILILKKGASVEKNHISSNCLFFRCLMAFICCHKRRRILFLHPKDKATAVEVFDLDAGIFFEELAQLGDVDIHGAGGEVVVVLPDHLQCLGS